MNNEDRDLFENIVGDYGETPKPEPGVTDRMYNPEIYNYQSGGRRQRRRNNRKQTRKSKSRRHRRRTSRQ
jgi:hypothetical protein